MDNMIRKDGLNLCQITIKYGEPEKSTGSSGVVSPCSSVLLHTI